jgi:hypothetical protein
MATCQVCQITKRADKCPVLGATIISYTEIHTGKLYLYLVCTVITNAMDTETVSDKGKSIIQTVCLDRCCSAYF